MVEAFILILLVILAWLIAMGLTGSVIVSIIAVLIVLVVAAPTRGRWGAHFHRRGPP